MFSQTQVIETDVYRPKLDQQGQPTGYLTYVGQRSLGEVYAALKERLCAAVRSDGEEVVSLWDALDYFNLAWGREGPLSNTDDFPACRWVACFAVEGSNEGHYVHVTALRVNAKPSGAEVMDLFIGKTFMGIDVALEVVATITRAFHR